jgi:hypothetical protein
MWVARPATRALRFHGGFPRGLLNGFRIPGVPARLSGRRHERRLGLDRHESVADCPLASQHQTEVHRAEIFAAAALTEKFHIPQKPKLHGSKRPFGPFGE